VSGASGINPENLGPLAGLAGAWLGDAGVDVSPSPSGAVQTAFRERMSFTPLGPVSNGPQTLYGLNYTTTAWPLDSEAPFHEEVGYWLWDADRQEVMRCFMVPRGVTMIAGGKVAADANQFTLAAECGSTTFGILSNPFLNEAFRTVRYDLSLEMNKDGSFSYHEDTQLLVPAHDSPADNPQPFHHTDSNHLMRCT